MSFYKLDEDNNFFIAPNAVYAPTYTLLATDYHTYTLPHDGWYWFETDDEAKVFFGLPVEDTTGG